MIKIGVLGAGGRMGQAIIAEVQAAADTWLAGGVERAQHPLVGREIGEGQVVGANAAPLARKADVLIDFSTPDALDEHLRAAEEARTAILVGTTGLLPAHHARLDRAAQQIPVLQAANTSLGVTLLAALVEQAARALDAKWDIEIAELHHRHKVDAPSGTALYLGEAAARGRGAPLESLRLPAHCGHSGVRRAGGIGFASLRGGSAAGEHKVIFATEGERLEFAHVAEGRELFAHGAVTAARWLAGQKPGRYQMADMLGLQAQASLVRQAGNLTGP
ncbi:4-hydroxy-tetrahydrodipicolinate reductase [Sandaracinobacter sp. RS1-74]|uniref:4-hydroxy-tetrahydrodipicolinate reductase n=1 Tax=Sandaracinobacteroides sayramensis TaxID=2913411 RepID=UPI001ED9CC00|nr:4-hydroxy-tetrahydrodipicolinate reductase [Sandaracinobacteroides sayramensis]MCG2841929.1 4-hydroxy-tetrahydrodipicolinate reductase [Sandaracinobacteroides sayramensis]